jgi:hypothetical protein
VLESDSAADETLVIFTNRSNPSRLKVCKVAGPGIPINTLFSFTVVGYGPTTPQHPQFSSYGVVNRTFDVRAGDPAQGGTCEFVPGFGALPPGYNEFQTFVNGTPIYIYENGISPNNTIPQLPGELRASQVRVFGSAFTSTAVAGFSPNPSINPGTYVPRPSGEDDDQDVADVKAPSGSGSQKVTAPNVIGGPVCNVPADYATISAAVADAGCTTINVSAGVYPEIVSVPAPRAGLIINGPNQAISACGGVRVAEAVVGNATGAFQILANNVIVRGFTMQGNTNGAFLGAGASIGANTTGVQFRNNIVQNNIVGLFLGGDSSIINGNLFRNNNNAGPASGTAIYTDQFVAGGTLSNVQITNNCFVGNNDSGLGFSSTDAAMPATGIAITGNTFTNNGRAFYMFRVTNSTFSNNRSTGATLTGSGDLRIFEGVSGLAINQNCLSGGIADAVRISNAGTGLPLATGVSMTGNSISNYAGDGIEILAGGYTGGLNAENNWWGSPSGPTHPSNPGGTGETIVDPGNQVDFTPFLVSEAQTPCAVPQPFVARAAVFARASIVEVEFTNYRFNPTVLKVCKIAGTDNLLGVNFNFTVALVSPQIGGANPGPIFPGNPSANVTVTAGPNNNQEGNCAFVNGASFPGGAFNQGSTITITEAALGGTIVTAIECPSCNGGLGVNLPARQATLNGIGGLVAGVNSVIFTNNDEGDRPGQVRFDFDGDKKADPAVWNTSTGLWSWRSSEEGGALKTRSFGQAGDKLVAADYDADGITDYAVFRPSNGQWYIQKSTGFFEYHNWGEATDIPQTGDYDGDGKADFIVFRPSNGNWYVKMATGQIAVFQFGMEGDKPYAADYDGDGRTDPGVFRNGTWYTLQSNTGFRITQFGQSGDIPVPADYDGDGAADFAVYRNGTWYMLSATSYTVKAHGEAADIPVPADYDGDGKADLAVFRSAEGRFYIKKSSLSEASLFEMVDLGSTNDISVQAQ